MKNNKLTKLPVVWAVAGLCCLLWGSAFPAIKIGYKLFEIESTDTANIILFAGVRFLLAGVLTILIFSCIQKKPLLPSKDSAAPICVLSLFQTIIQYVFFYLGLAYTTGERASIIQGSNVFVALIITCFLFKFEKFKINKLIGCALGFIGVILVSLDVFSQSVNPSFVGEIMVFICTVSYSFSSVFMKKYSERFDPAMLSGWQFVLGGGVMIIISLCMSASLKTVNARGIILLVYLALVSAVAYSLWSMLLKYNPVSKVAVCGSMTPVFGFILSSIFAGEGQRVGILGVLALIFVASGIIIVNVSIDKKA